MDWNLRQLRKSSTDRQLDGICGGLGEYTPLPSWMWRVAFVALCFAGGAGVVAYLILSLLMPKAGSAGAAAGTTWDLHALRRATTHAQVGGVCAGLGEYTPVPAWLWRAGFIGMALAGGAGIVAYVLMWAFVPAENQHLSRV